MLNVLKRLFAIDLRSLALFRMGLGAILLADLAVRATSLVAHYTDTGLLPRSLATLSHSDRWWPSLHMLSGEPSWQIALFCLAATVSVALLLGWRTRWATVISWILLISLQNRNHLVLNGGDGLLRMLLFWSMFLPLGARWSLDSRLLGDRRGRRLTGPTVSSVPAACLLLQVAIVYWMTAAFKWNDDWLGGLGVYYSLSYDAYARPLAAWLLQYPQLMGWLSVATVWWEAVGPVLAFSPIWTGPLRIAVCLGFVLFHLGIELTITVGCFSYIAAIAWAPFLPSKFWDFLQGREPPDVEPAAPGRLARAGRIAGSAFLLVVLAYIVCWNLRTLGVKPAQRIMSPAVRQVGYATGLAQRWNMFERKITADGWLVAVATLEEGPDIDLLTGRPVDFEKPAVLAYQQPNHRWRKYLRNLATETYAEPYRAGLCHYLADRWQATGGPELRRIDLYLVEEITPPPGEPTTFRRRRLHRETYREVGAFQELLEQGSGDLPRGV